MNKYAQGLYHVLLFDKFGGKVDTMVAGNFMQAQRIGKDILNEEPCNINSYIVVHILYNSLMGNDKLDWKNNNRDMSI